ncbi:hypothetical protein HWV62_30429 [Athelia sp. TMB]|nr:hypothetical protein HWV62_42665 [Athelia sp. TMB]KAF7982101.1 hypothetical protein HWV62_30429 [Athelia sp. TMB]
MASFAPKPGCPMCSIVSTASHAPHNSPRSPSFPVGSTQPEVLWRDDNFTAYREKANPVSSKGHIIIAFNDLPLLVNVRNLANRLLSSLVSSTSSPSVTPATVASPTSSTAPRVGGPDFHVGFITPPFKDNKIPVTDHLHAHAYIGNGDLMGWWRGVAYSSVAWYSIDDLIAEIRYAFRFRMPYAVFIVFCLSSESVSNNRIKSGYRNRNAPIDEVADAGARSGAADGTEFTEPSLAVPDEEAGEGTPGPSSRPLSPNTLSPQSQIPHLRV